MARIRRYGLPVYTRLVQEGGKMKFICLSRPGFTHLSSPYTVRKTIKSGTNYHVTLGWVPDPQQDPVAHAARIRIIQQYGWNWHRHTIWVREVTWPGRVARFSRADPFFSPRLADCEHLRQHYGNHHTQYLTMSM